MKYTAFIGNRHSRGGYLTHVSRETAHEMIRVNCGKLERLNDGSRKVQLNDKDQLFLTLPKTNI